MRKRPGLGSEVACVRGTPNEETSTTSDHCPFLSCLLQKFPRTLSSLLLLQGDLINTLLFLHLSSLSTLITFIHSQLHTLLSPNLIFFTPSLSQIKNIISSSSFWPLMKRQRENQSPDNLDLAISLVLLSQHKSHNISSSSSSSSSSSLSAHEFECKTCNRKFSSFQALGGHRASHKKPKLDSLAEQPQIASSARPLHECSICGQRFSLGQALGGHMRKHRAAMDESSPSLNEVVANSVPVLKRCNSKRVMGLDLNLTPLENDLKLLFGNKAPPVNLLLC